MVSETSKLRMKRKMQRAGKRVSAEARVGSKMAKRKAASAANAASKMGSSLYRRGMETLGMGPSKAIPNKRVKGSTKNKNKPVGNRLRASTKAGKASKRRSTSRSVENN